MSEERNDPNSLSFNEVDSFADNCDAFLTRLEIVDAEMARILRDNWNELVGIVNEGDRDLKARSELNSKIASMLDSLVVLPEEHSRD